jgi:hypothetical protein
MKVKSNTASLLPVVLCLTLLAGCDWADFVGRHHHERDRFSMGVALSPRGHTSHSTDQDWVDFFTDHAAWGRIIAFHTNWRNDVTTAGRPPDLAVLGAAASTQYGFTPVFGIGWANGAGEPDLTSQSDPHNNSWTNEESRSEYLTMITDFAKANHPPFLFLGNEVDFYYTTHSTQEWNTWLEVFKSAHDSVKAVSPETVVYSTVQFEHLVGVGRYNGWSNAPMWQVVDDLVKSGGLDALGFTSYPYFEYGTPDDIPDDYYDRILDHWDGPVIFSEIGWPGADNDPYPGGEADQAAFITRFFDLSSSLDLRYVVWVYLHDWDGQDSQPAFRWIGLRTNDGRPRTADGVWRSEVILRE